MDYTFERSRTDITLFDENKNRVVVIETKRPKENLDAETWRAQAGKYADASTHFVGLTNGYRFILWEIKNDEKLLKSDIDFRGLISSKKTFETKLSTKEVEQILFLNNITKGQIWSEAKYLIFDPYYAKVDVSENEGFDKLIEQLNYISNDILRQYTYYAFAEYSAGYGQYKQTKDEIEGLKKLNGDNRKQAAEIAKFELKTEGKYKKYATFAGYYIWKAISDRPDEKEEENKQVFCKESIYVILNRLLFIRICEDKGLLSKKISNGGIEKLREQLYEPVMPDAGVFKQIIFFSYNGANNLYHHFYEKDNPLDWYESGDGELDHVLNRVLWILNQFNFAKVDRDILGKLYEKYLPKEERRALGEFYTPDEVIDYILDAVEYVPTKAIENKDLIDPACGSGGFLVRATIRLIARHVVKLGKATPKEALDNKKWHEVYERLTPKECEEIVNSVALHIHGFDINPFAVSISEMNILFQIIDLYFKAVKGNKNFKVPRFKVYETDSLEIPNGQLNMVQFYGASGKNLAKDKEVTDELKKGKYDFVVGNPPYVRTHEQYLLKKRIIKDFGEVVDGQFDLFIPFVKFGYDILTTEGKLSYIISNKLLSNDYAVKLRKFLIENCTIQEIIDSSEIEWFAASVYPVIFVVRKTETPGITLSMGHIQNASELKAGHVDLIELPTLKILRLYNSIIPAVRSKKEFDLLLALSEFNKDFKVFRPKPTSINIIGKSDFENKPEVIREKYVPVVSNEDVLKFYITANEKFIDKSLKDTPEKPHVLMKKLCKIK
jgi:type I restriction-modification system DNA methylase subunit